MKEVAFPSPKQNWDAFLFSYCFLIVSHCAFISIFIIINLYMIYDMLFREQLNGDLGLRPRNDDIFNLIICIKYKYTLPQFRIIVSKKKKTFL